VWQWVRNRRIANQKFRREYPIPPYTADFCCVELKLILEVHGVEHFTEDGRQRDRVRDDFLESQCYRVAVGSRSSSFLTKWRELKTSKSPGTKCKKLLRPESGEL
jgi:hypothetical protein